MAKKKLGPKTVRSRAARKTINGKPVVDADRPLILKIDRSDIRGSKVGSPDNCPGARAIMRQEDVMAAHVYRAVVYVERGDKVERYTTPFRLRQETISFDRGAPDKFIEGDYRLLPPKGSHKLGADRRRLRVGGADKRPAPTEVAGARPRNAGNHGWI